MEGLIWHHSYFMLLPTSCEKYTVWRQCHTSTVRDLREPNRFTILRVTKLRKNYILCVLYFKQ